MENDVLDSLEDLGYNGNLLDEQALRTALEVGPSSIEFTQLTSWLTEQLKNLCGLEENVNSITSPEDANNFIMELSGFLRELNCPHRHLFEGGPVTERLHTRQNKLQLLDYLTSELQAVKILADRKPMSLQSPDKDSSDSPSENESDVAKHLKIMLIALGFPKPPGDITPFQLFSKVENKVKQLITQYPNQIGKSLLKARLSDKQWQQVLKINDALLREYSTRREMILKRLDVTIQSFMWSEVAKKKQNDIAVVYQPVRKLLTAKCSLGVAQILAARDDLTKLQKTSSGDVREKTKCAINRVRIPKVPDRGGRAWELEPPPPEMPSFQKRVDQPQGQRPQSARGGGRGGGGRGGKVQGSWSDGGQQSFGGNWNQGGGGYGGGGGQGRDHYSKGGGYSQGGGGYSQGGGGYNQGGGGYNQGGGGYNQGGGGYNQGGGGYNQGGYNQGDYNQGGYQQDGGRGGKRGRGGRGRGGGRGGNR